MVWAGVPIRIEPAESDAEPFDELIYAWIHQHPVQRERSRPIATRNGNGWWMALMGMRQVEEGRRFGHANPNLVPLDLNDERDNQEHHLASESSMAALAQPLTLFARGVPILAPGRLPP